jgi:hypothetical protein
MRLAYFGPLPPLPGTIAQFGRDLVPALAEHAEIDLWVDGTDPVPVDVTGFRVVRYVRGDPKLTRLGSYDARLYQMYLDGPARSPLHEIACSYPGVVVLHESAEPSENLRQSGDADAASRTDRVLGVASGLIVHTEKAAARVLDRYPWLRVATIHGCAAHEYARFIERVSGGIEPLRITLVQKLIAELASMGATGSDAFLIDEVGDAVDRTLGDG